VILLLLNQPPMNTQAINRVSTPNFRRHPLKLHFRRKCGSEMIF
jgi:hypothetical protein